VNTSGGASPEIRLRTATLTPSETRARAEHPDALNLDFDTWLDER
jgi:hypothetical protein